MKLRVTQKALSLIAVAAFSCAGMSHAAEKTGVHPGTPVVWSPMTQMQPQMAQMQPQMAQMHR